MTTPIIIPSLGESISEVVLGQWLVNDGEWVDRDAPLVEIESDKVTQELPSPVSGVVRITVQNASECSIGDTIGSVDEAAPKPAAAIDETTPSTSATIDVTTETVASAAQTRKATPLAHKMANDMGVSLDSIEGSGPSGRITKSDILSSDSSEATEPVPVHPAQQFRAIRREKMSPLRKRIAQRLVEAQHSAAMLTTFNEVDMTNVIELRKLHKEEFNDKYGINLGFMSFFTKACVSALAAWPVVNASLVDGEVEYHEYVDMSVAVGTDKGLVVPVVRNTERKSFAEIELNIKELALKARENKLTMDDMTGGTFTISNGGVYGSMMSTPILNPPQSGILGLHRIQNRAVEDPSNPGQITLRPMMYLALSYDHRLVDGEGAVSFLVHVKNCIEDPQRLLLGL
tara:strand:- start:1102 stop:2304 length:1203 start_codon:yes stop_codon:yes gene_type:complete